MQKWHIHRALGRQIPSSLQLQDILVRQISLSAQQAQEPRQDTYGLPPRRVQQRDVTDRVAQHFSRIDSSRDGRSPRSSLPSYRTLDLGAIDARDLAAPPRSASRPPRSSNGGDRASALRSPLDARDLGAQRPNNGPRIFNPRSRPDRGSQKSQAPRIFPRRDSSDRQPEGGTTSFQHNRNRAPPDRNRQAHSTRGPVGPKNRDRAPRSSFNGGERSKEVGDEPSGEEIAYLNSRDSISTYSDMIYEGGAANYIDPGDRIYKPANMLAETLQGMGPALACGEWGMSETVGEKLIQVNKKQNEYDERIEELASKFGEGVFCHFRTKQERIDTMKTVERNLAGQGDNAKLDEEQEKEKMAMVDARMTEERAKLATRLLKGDYYVGPLGKGPTAELLERYTRKNETYMPKDSQSLAGKIATLLPLGNAAAQGSTART
ncbi:MAG: hypothetical protein Q9171_004469 [Xanthocarpia ochracea]